MTIINPNSVPIPSNVEAIVNSYNSGGRDVIVDRLIDGKFLLWDNSSPLGTGLIDGVTHYASRKLFEDLGIGFHGDKHPKEFDPERVSELFSDYIALSMALGATFTFNTFYDIETADKYGVGKHLSAELKKSHVFLYNADGTGNGRGFYWPFGGFSSNPEILKPENLRSFMEKIRRNLGEYEVTGFDTNQNLLYILCVGANQRHDTPDGFIPFLLDEELQRTFPTEMPALAQAIARNLQVRFATNRSMSPIFEADRVRFVDLALERFVDLYGITLPTRS